MKKNIVVLTAFLTGLFLYADNEDYGSQDVSDEDFSGRSLRDSNWCYSKAIGTNFSNADLTSAYFISSTLTNANFTDADLTSASFNSSIFTNANFTDAIITGAYFTDITSKGFTKEQLYSTASYKNKDLSTIRFCNNDFTSWDFSKQNLRSASFDLSNLTNAKFQNAYLTNTYFISSTLTNANFTDAIIAGVYFENTTSKGFIKEQLYSTASYKNKDLGGIKLYNNDLTGWNFSGQNLTNADFYSSTLTNADFTDAIIAGAYFDNTTSKGFTKEQLYSTASYKNKNLVSIKLGYNDLTGWNFSGQNLQKTDFYNANITNVNACYADFRGASGLTLQYLDIVIIRNTIWDDGFIKNFAMESSDDSFSIRKYEPVSVGDTSISAKLNASSSISGGAILTLEKGAEFDVVNNSTLTLSEDSVIVINTDLNSSTKFVIEEGALFKFLDGAKLVINLEDFDWSELNSEIFKFSVMNWEDVSKISGFENLTKGEDIILKINSNELASSFWNYEITNDGLYISVPEPLTYASIFGALALAFVAYRRRK